MKRQPSNQCSLALCLQKKREMIIGQGTHALDIALEGWIVLALAGLEERKEKQN